MNSFGLTGRAVFTLAFLCVGLVLSAPATAQRVLLDKIVALVDEGVVLQSELNSRLLEIHQRAARADESLPDEDVLREEVLEALVLENLQLQFANRISIRFDDDTLNRVLNNMAQNSNMSFDEYIAALERNGVYLQTREQVRKQMTLQELQRGIVNRRISITDQEIENFLNSEMGKEVLSADYLVDHILIATTEFDSDEIVASKLKYAADLVARIQEGDDFVATRATAQQAGLFQITGANFGWRKADRLPGVFADIVVNMSIDDIEGPIKAGNGFHIIKLTNKRGGTEQIVNQTNLRHIMLSPNEIRTDEQSRVAIERLRQRIVDGEDFGTIARQNSDDASSVVSGGDLEWVSEGGMPPAMEVIIDELAVGELSQPFRSDTGWHIAEVLGRRVSDLSGEYSRNQAENTLRNRKFDLELENWLLEIREEAFVEFID